jgi:hypothetical protein
MVQEEYGMVQEEYGMVQEEYGLTHFTIPCFDLLSLPGAFLLFFLLQPLSFLKVMSLLSHCLALFLPTAFPAR